MFQNSSEKSKLEPRKMSLGTPEIQFLGPMMLPNLNLGSKIVPNGPRSALLGNESGPRGTLRESSGAPRGTSMDYSTELLENPGEPWCTPGTAQPPGSSPSASTLYYISSYYSLLYWLSTRSFLLPHTPLPFGVGGFAWPAATDADPENMIKDRGDRF